MATKSSPIITIFRGFPETGCYVWSPFVTKLEAVPVSATSPTAPNKALSPKLPVARSPMSPSRLASSRHRRSQIQPSSPKR
ncbi:hypothetical protein V6000_009959 [Aspergillus fumigatus]